MTTTLPRRLGLSALAVLLITLTIASHPSSTEAARITEPCDGEDPGAVNAATETPRKRGHFEALADVALSTKVEERLNMIGKQYRKRTGKTFVVTSGIRDPDSQAHLIYSKLQSGEDLLKLYKDKSAVMELVRVYDAAREEKKSKSTTVTLLATAIRAQMRRGIYISAHLKAGAADVRSSTMTPGEKRTFAEAAKDAGLAVMLESTPPHFHLQLD